MAARSNRKSGRNFQNWKLSQKYIKRLHNQAVVAHFRTGDAPARLNTRNSLLIYPKDTVAQCQIKMQCFKDYIERSTPQDLIAFPLSWSTKLHPEIPQLAIIYTSPDPKNRSTYSLHIPHYNGSRNPRFKPHTKGNWWGIYKLRDGSRLTAYCYSKAEVERVIREMMRYVEKRYLPDSKKIPTGYMPHKPFKTIDVRPVRAQYYSKGKKNNRYPDWTEEL